MELSEAELEAILAVANTDVDEVAHAVDDPAGALFSWRYTKGERPRLSRLYDKAKGSMWDAEVDVDWSVEVDQEKVAAANAVA
ncbi:MAG: ferritin-like domain-containing protein, partial [Acidimicrobiales bacterium]